MTSAASAPVVPSPAPWPVQDRPLFEIIVENFNALRTQLVIQLLRRSIGGGIALLEVENRNPERRDRFRPLYAGVIMESLDDGGDEARRPDAVGAHVDSVLTAIGTGNDRPHRLGIFGAEIEDVTDLDASRR